MADVIGGARLHQSPHAKADGPRGDRHGLADGAPEEALAPRIGRMHDAFVTRGDERVRQFQGVYDAAPRIRRMGEDGDAERPRVHAAGPMIPQPISGARAKSQIVSSVAPSEMTTRRSAVTAPIALAERPRAEKSPTTAATSEGATDRR